jgi:hypothetical protein
VIPGDPNCPECLGRRSFLTGLGAALAAVAVTTRLGEAKLPELPADEQIDVARYLTDPDSWYIAVDPGGKDHAAISTFYRHRNGDIELLDTQVFKGVKRFSQGVVP